MRRAAVAIATVGGLGYFPIAPGTVGSAAGVALYLVTTSWNWTAQLALIAAVSLVGIWASTEAARHFKREDPGAVVVDEVAGQLVTLFAIGGVGLLLTWRGLLIGFFIFRALDIIKPYPANRFERLHGGLGIMADDLMAGVYGNLLMWAVVSMFPSMR
jgi:phosphatidylglycerophosphatase A